MEEESKQPWRMEKTQVRPTNSFRDGRVQGGVKQLFQNNQLKVGIGGVFNRNTITHYSWWETSVFCFSNARMVDWEWLKGKVEEIGGEVEIRPLDDQKAVMDTKSREHAWRIANIKGIEENGVRVELKRWTPECGGLGEEFFTEKNRRIKLCGIPYHLRFEEAAKKIMNKFCKSFVIEMDHSRLWGNEDIFVRMQGVKLEEVPRVVYVEERGYRFPVEIVIVEDVEQKRMEEEVQRSKGDDDGVRTVQKGAASLGGKEEGVPVIQDVEKHSKVVQVEGTISEQAETSQRSNKDKASEWVQVTGNSRSTKPTETKSWADVVKSNQYEVLEEVVLETQSTKGKQVAENAGPSHQHRSKPLVSKSGPTHSFNSGYPSLKLSRMFWPNHRAGKKERFSRVKRIARQALEKESLRLSKASREQQDLECVSILSDSEDSVSSPLCDNKDTTRRDKGVQIIEKGGQSDSAKTWVRKGSVSVCSKGDSKDGPPGFERNKEEPIGVNFAQLIEQECCHLRNEEEVNAWVGNIIDPITKKLKLSSVNGEDAIRKFFTALGHAKLKEKKEVTVDDDERECLNYANCNEDVRGKKVS
ncbi:hypothetical protein FRX31_007113 [Thalictrum thalictroides]|uniref:DUF4283 domain-containing protein n=1 Tax=Thalictrum thalictroides TaxID=46969 RepID=A0A7J6X3U6_THATH|nr:hypothetical protein FRX31_007113 [Thalictrum thalictroides]